MKGICVWIHPNSIDLPGVHAPEENTTHNDIPIAQKTFKKQRLVERESVPSCNLYHDSCNRRPSVVVNDGG